jgi:uncharacterized protein YndB with AHSA1/START domain
MTDEARDEVAAEALVYEFDLDAPPEKVWRAIATPELREAWLGEPEGGAAEVVRSEPGAELDLLWPTREGQSLVSFEIRDGEAGSTTRLTIVHRLLESNVVALAPRRATAQRWRMAA